MRSQIFINQIRAVLLVTFACQLSFSLAGDGPNRNFEHITTQDGLSSGLVTAIAQDPAGFLWIGTQSGLNRYDGSGIHTYYARDQDPSSLSHNAIWSLAIDSQNRMWVGSRGGLDLYLPVNNSFLQTDVRAEVRAILEIEIGLLWLGTSDGLFQYDEKSNTLSVIPELNGLTVRCLVRDSLDRIWICTQENGLFYASKVELETTVERIPPKTLSASYIRGVAVDSDNGLWIGTYDTGLVHLDRDLQRSDLPINTGQSLSAKRVRSVLMSESGSLLVGSDAGIRVISPEGKTEVGHFRIAQSAAKFVNNSALTLFEDSGKNLWIGTFDGLARTTASKLPFEWIRTPEPSNNLITIYKNQAGGLYGGHFLGLLSWNENLVPNKKFPKPKWLPGPRVSSFAEQGGYLWVGSMANGLVRRNLRTEETLYFRNEPDDFSSLSSDRITKILVDEENQLWVSTYGGGVNLLLSDGSFRRFPDDTNPAGHFSSMLCLDIEMDASGNLWIATDGGGLIVMDSVTGDTRTYRHGSTQLVSDFLTDVELGEKGAWIGSVDNGLSFVRFDSPSVTNPHFGQFQGRPVYSLLEVDSQNLWFSAQNSIYRLGIVSGELERYDASHGIQPGELNANVSTILEDGRVVFGGSGGITVFDPSLVEKNKNIPRLIIEGVDLDNSGYMSTAGKEGGVQVDYLNRSIKIQFAALDYRAPEKNRYKYKLEGFDSDWVDNGTDRDATYTNLEPGEYIFRVIGSNNDGVWNTEGASLPITVQPAPWVTWWAYALYALIGVVCYYTYHRWNFRRVNRDSERVFNERLAMYLFSLNHTDECVFNADIEERIIFVNTPAVQVFDKHIGHLQASNFFELIFKSEEEGVEARTRLSAEGRYKGEVEYETDAGDKVLEVNLSKFDDPSERVSYIGVVRDVTASTKDRQVKEGLLQRAALEMQERKKQLERDAKLAEAEIISLKQASDEKAGLLRDIHDRVNENLLMLNSLLNIQASKIKDSLTLGLLDDSQQRVMALSLVHENILGGEDVRGVAMQSYLDALTSRLHRRFAPEGLNILLNLVVDDIALDIEQAVPCGMIINELVINSLVHGFAEKKFGSGNLSILLEDMGRDCALTVSDDGCGMPMDLSVEGSMGLEIVTILSLQLGGNMKRVGGPGTTFEIRFPLMRKQRVSNE